MKNPAVLVVLTLWMGAVSAAHGQSLPSLRPPPANWCTVVEAPNGRLARWCARLDRWRKYAAVSCLRADAIGRPPSWSQDNSSPYWQAASHCTSAKTALAKVEQTAREADAAYQQALVARQKLWDMSPK
jgi:hypothetical protein